jgi:EmrB/QacA subfamily drug resistance transporter
MTLAPNATEPGHGEAKPRHRGFVLAVLCVSLLIVSLDNTILNVALPTIVRAMHASSSELQWVVDAYAVVFAGLLLVGGSLGDRVGRKWVLMGGLVVFATGSALSAFSGTPDHLILARAFMGVGAAAIMPSTLSILTNVFTKPADRARAIGVWSGTTGLGVAIGPVAGGWLLAHFWWGSVFLVNVPIATVGLVAALWSVPNSRATIVRRPDVVGSVLSILGMGVLLWAIIEAPGRGWTSPLVLGSGALALVTLAGFFLWERHSTHPMLELSFFSSRRFSVAVVAMGFVIFALMGGLFVLTQYLQFSLGYSAFQAGLRVVPIAAVLLVVAPLSTVAVRRVGSKVVVFGGMAMVALGLGLLTLVTPSTTYGDVLPAFLCIGVGTGLAFAPSTESVMGSLPLDRAGVGSATNGAALQTGGALGVAVLGSLLSTRYQGQLTPVLLHHRIPGSALSIILGSLGGTLAVAQHVGGHLGAELAALGRRAFVSGMNLATLAGSVAVGTASIIILVALPGRPPALSGSLAASLPRGEQEELTGTPAEASGHAHDDDRAVGLRDAVLADRAEQHAGEAPVTAAAHHEQLCSEGTLHQDRRRVPLEGHGSDVDIGSRLAGPLDGIAEDGFGVVRRVIVAGHGHVGHAQGGGPFPHHGELETRPGSRRLASGPLHGDHGAPRAVDADDDGPGTVRPGILRPGILRPGILRRGA